LSLVLRQQVQQQPRAFLQPMRRWISSIGLALAVGIAYFLASRLSLGLLTDAVAVFWPAAGVAAGVLIAFGPSARLPVVAGTIAATILANVLSDRTVWSSIVFALCNGGEAVLVAGLIKYYFGSPFSLGRLSHALGLFIAAIVGTAVSGIGGTLGFVLFQGSTTSILTLWSNWVASDALGIVTVAPLFIGVVSAVSNPPPRSEGIEGFAVLGGLSFLTAIIMSLPQEPWKTVVPAALLFPMVLCLAARCRPAFAAAGSFIVSLSIIWSTVFGIGHFGDATSPINDRVLEAQGLILVVTLGALVLAALFSERRENTAQLANSNLMLQRERDDKLMNLDAMLGGIAHEVKQPLAAIMINGEAALQILELAPSNFEEARSALKDIVGDSHRANEVLDSVRSLFRKHDQDQQTIDMNELVRGVLNLLRAELKEHRVAIRTELATNLPLVAGNRVQLQQVILILVHNAVEAMVAINDESRVLRLNTNYDGCETVTIAVEDSGSGIDPTTLENIFDTFVTTKIQGMGLGLAMCRTIVERHGGHISASSAGKSGARFQFILPIKRTPSSNG
jgi:signal transduction histidine kinase